MSGHSRAPWCLRHNLILVISAAASHLDWLPDLDAFAAVRRCPRCRRRRP